MDQKEINDQEWNTPANWIGPGWCKKIWYYYNSEKDSRVWVPRKPKWAGWTMNYGHKKYGKLMWRLGYVIAFLGALTFVGGVTAMIVCTGR